MRTLAKESISGTVKAQWLLGKHALVTGASSGIGRELTKQLVGVCRKLTLVARNANGQLESLKRELDALQTSRNVDVSTETEECSLDVCNVAGMVNLLRRIYEGEKDQVDVFVNCAGGSHIYGTLESMSHSDIERIFDTNAKAPILWLRELLPRMKKNVLKTGDLKRAHIVMLSSRSGERTLSKLSVYTAAKGSIEKLVEAMQKEYAQHRIVFTVMNPGSINTAFTAQWDPNTRDAHNEESMAAEEAVIPIVQVLQAQFAINKVSYESVEQWLNEPGVIRDGIGA